MHFSIHFSPRCIINFIPKPNNCLLRAPRIAVQSNSFGMVYYKAHPTDCVRGIARSYSVRQLSRSSGYLGPHRYAMPYCTACAHAVGSPRYAFLSEAASGCDSSAGFNRSSIVTLPIQRRIVKSAKELILSRGLVREEAYLC